MSNDGGGHVHGTGRTLLFHFPELQVERLQHDRTVQANDTLLPSHMNRKGSWACASSADNGFSAFAKTSSIAFRCLVNRKPASLN